MEPDRVCPTCHGEKEVLVAYVHGHGLYEKCVTCWGWGIQTEWMRWEDEQARRDPVQVVP